MAKKAKAKKKKEKLTSAGIRIPGSNAPRKPRSFLYCIICAALGALMLAWGVFCFTLQDYPHAITGVLAGILLMLVANREYEISKEAKTKRK